jgi:putative transposase
VVQSSKRHRPFSVGGGGRHPPPRVFRGLPTAHFAPTLSPEAQRKLDAIRVAQTAGVEVAARAFQVHRSTIYRWLERYEPYRLRLLEPRSRAPKQRSRPVVWTAHDEALIIAVRTAHPRWGKAKLTVLLKAQGCTLSESTIGRLLTRLIRTGRIREPRLRGKPRRLSRRPIAVRKPKDLVPSQPGDLVQVDTVHLAPVPGVTRRQFSAIDVVSRMAVVGVRGQATAKTAAAFLTDLVSTFPVPIRAIQVDGGSEFMAEFEDTCAQMDIALYVLPPRSPKLNGRVERFNRTSQEEFWQCYDDDLTLAPLAVALQNWVREYNQLRPHQALQMRTPAVELARLLTS